MTIHAPRSILRLRCATPQDPSALFLKVTALLTCVVLCAPLTLAKHRARADKPETSVIKIAREFPDGGAYNTKWAGSGTPEEIRHKDQRILAKGEGGTYCCGFTFAVVMRAAAVRGLLADKSVDEVRKFQKQWYGASDDADVKERQCVLAVEKLGIGKAVPEHKDAKPGDFAQLWRTSKSGHSVVFLEWVEERGRRVGIKYRSSQQGTQGIGDRVEYFSDFAGKDGKVLRDRTYFCRLDEPQA